MKKFEAAIIQAFTGISLGGPAFNEFHRYVEEKFGRPVFTHEMANKEFWEKIKELAYEDLVKIVDNLED